MSLPLSATLLVSVVTAQLTTSAWLPGAADENQTLFGSVITQEGDHTTLSLGCGEQCISTENYGVGPKHFTVGGTTYVAYQQFTTNPANGFVVTMDLACSRENGSAAPTCTTTPRGPESENLGSHCSTQGGISTNTHTVTDTPWSNNSPGSPIIKTHTQTLSNACTGVLDPDVFPQITTTMTGDEQSSMNNFKLVITAGTEKLEASAAATPTGSGAHLTTGISSSSAESSKVTQATGAAAPVRSLASVLAGLGAAAAFFV